MPTLKQKVVKGAIWTLLEKRVGSYASIAAGTAVTKNIPSMVMAAGVPVVVKKEVLHV